MNATVEQELEVVKQEVSQFANGVPAVIESQAQFIEGSACVVEIGKEIKKRRAWFDLFLAPAKEAKAAAIASLKAQEAIMVKTLEPISQADQTLRNALINFKRQEDERVRKEQEKQNKLYEQRMERAEKKGKPADEVRGPVVLATPQKSTKAEGGGGFTVTAKKVLVIVDEEKIPDQYWIKTLNRKLIETNLRANVLVPGALLEDDYGSSVRTA